MCGWSPGNAIDIADKIRTKSFTEFNLLKSRNFGLPASQTKNTLAYPITNISYSNSNTVLNYSSKEKKNIE
jgi:hypothetical protein